MISSFVFGHKVFHSKGKWHYYDNGELVKNQRACPKYGKFPTVDGHAPCLGIVPNAISACCGQGVHELILIIK